MNIMITGAAGGYGSGAVKYVKQFAPNDNIYALIHNTKNKSKLEKLGLKVRVGDYSNYNSMIDALNGIDRLLFVSVSIPNIQKNVVLAAKEAGVKFIAYTGIADPQYQKFGLQTNHLQTKNWIKESGIPYTILRNNWYLDIMQDYIVQAVKSSNFLYFADKGKIAFALKREYAEAGARVITGSGYPSILTLAGNPISFRELGENIAINNKITINNVNKDNFKFKANKIGMSSTATMLSDSYQEYTLLENNGENNLNSETFEKVLGHPLTPISEAIEELI